MICPLCTTNAPFYFRDQRLNRDYFHCSTCDLRFVDPSKHLPPSEELARYQSHNNDTEDVRYQEYMRPIAEWVQAHASNKCGLDFGCGNGPVLAQILTEMNFEMQLYDPYFYPDRSYAKRKYDFCVAVEAAEHFYQPACEFHHLKGLLNDAGGIGIVTALVTDKINFETWFYRLDPTHVCFYSTNTFEWIKNEFGFQEYRTDGIRLNWLSCS